MKTAIAVKDVTRSGIFGAVDAFDPQFGLTGWCADIFDGARQLKVELVVNSVPVAATRTTHLRRDVCEKIGVEGRFGYCFDAAAFDAFLLNKTIYADKDYSVRVFGEASFLLAQGSLPDLGAILEAREAYLKCSEGRALVESLERVRESACDLLFQPPKKAAVDSDGVIEAIAQGDGNMIWFVGWVSGKGAPEFPAVVLDRRKYPAGLRCAYYRREDLAEPAVGVVGAILADWRPSASSEALILFGEKAENHLRMVRPLRMATIEDVLGHLLGRSDPDSQALARQLFTLVSETDGWKLETPAAKKIKLAIDRAQYVEGFGVFLKGWVLGPMHRIKGMALKLGDRIFESASSSLHFSPRPDLAAAFPVSGAAIDRAGFTGVFRGELRGADLDDAILRLTYENDKSTHHKLGDLSIDRIPATSDLSELRNYYRVLERASFFPLLALAYYEFCGAVYRRATGEIVSPGATALIFCVPAERHLQYYLFEQLREHLAGCSAQGVGLVIVADESSRHGEIGELFAQISERFSGPASLVFVGDVECCAWSLASILSLVDARRFIFVGPDVVLDPEGWSALGSLIDAKEDLAFFGITDPEQPWLPARTGTSAFSWSTQAWNHWACDHRLALRAPMDGEAFPVGPRRVVSGGEFARKSALPPLIEQVNLVLGVGTKR